MLFVLGGALAVCLIKAIVTKGITNRIVAVNMIGTFVIMVIAVLSVLLDEAYLCDIAMIYSLASFISSIALTKIYIGIIGERRSKASEADPEVKK